MNTTKFFIRSPGCSSDGGAKLTIIGSEARPVLFGVPYLDETVYMGRENYNVLNMDHDLEV